VADSDAPMLISLWLRRESVYRMVADLRADRSRILLRNCRFYERDLEKLARADRSIPANQSRSRARWTYREPPAIFVFRDRNSPHRIEAHITDNVAFQYTFVSRAALRD